MDPDRSGRPTPGLAALRFDLVKTAALHANTREDLLALWEQAYGEDMSRYFGDVGPGVHLLGRIDGVLVTHAMFVERWLQLASGSLLRTAYVELVATRVGEQRRGYASVALRRLAEEIGAFDIGGLSPSDERFYARLGWERWRGDLLVRTDTAVVPSPGEQLMVMRLPRTPPTLSLDAPVSIGWRRGEIW